MSLSAFHPPARTTSGTAAATRQGSEASAAVIEPASADAPVAHAAHAAPMLSTSSTLVAQPLRPPAPSTSLDPSNPPTSMPPSVGSALGFPMGALQMPALAQLYASGSIVTPPQASFPYFTHPQLSNPYFAQLYAAQLSAMLHPLNQQSAFLLPLDQSAHPMHGQHQLYQLQQQQLQQQQLLQQHQQQQQLVHAFHSALAGAAAAASIPACATSNTLAAVPPPPVPLNTATNSARLVQSQASLAAGQHMSMQRQLSASAYTTAAAAASASTSLQQLPHTSFSPQVSKPVSAPLHVQNFPSGAHMLAASGSPQLPAANSASGASMPTVLHSLVPAGFPTHVHQPQHPQLSHLQHLAANAVQLSFDPAAAAAVHVAAAPGSGLGASAIAPSSLTGSSPGALLQAGLQGPRPLHFDPSNRYPAAMVAAASGGVTHAHAAQGLLAGQVHATSSPATAPTRASIPLSRFQPQQDHLSSRRQLGAEIRRKPVENSSLGHAQFATALGHGTGDSDDAASNDHDDDDEYCGQGAADPASKRQRVSLLDRKSTTDRQILICDICHKHYNYPGRFIWYQSLSGNMVPGELAGLLCGLCGDNLLSDSSRRSDASYRIHSCYICNMQFKRADRLIAHSQLHNGVKAFSCQHCVKTFSRKDRLKKHLVEVHSVHIDPSGRGTVRRGSEGEGAEALDSATPPPGAAPHAHPVAGSLSRVAGVALPGAELPSRVLANPAQLAQATTVVSFSPSGGNGLPGLGSVLLSFGQYAHALRDSHAATTVITATAAATATAAGPADRLVTTGADSDPRARFSEPSKSTASNAVPGHNAHLARTHGLSAPIDAASGSTIVVAATAQDPTTEGLSPSTPGSEHSTAASTAPSSETLASDSGSSENRRRGGEHPNAAPQGTHDEHPASAPATARIASDRPAHSRDSITSFRGSNSPTVDFPPPPQPAALSSEPTAAPGQANSAPATQTAAAAFDEDADSPPTGLLIVAENED